MHKFTDIYIFYFFKPENAESLFKSLPSTPIVFQFASLYYSVKLFTHVGVPLFSSDSEVDLDPASIIRRVILIVCLFMNFMCLQNLTIVLQHRGRSAWAWRNVLTQPGPADER